MDQLNDYKLPITNLLSEEEVIKLNKQFDNLLHKSTAYSAKMPGCWSTNNIGTMRRVYASHMLLDYTWLLDRLKPYADDFLEDKSVFFTSRFVQEEIGFTATSNLHQDIMYTGSTGPKRYAVFGIFLTDCSPGNAVRVLTSWVPEDNLMAGINSTLHESELPEVQVWHSLGGKAGQVFCMSGNHIHQTPITAYTQTRRILWLIYNAAEEGNWEKSYIQARLNNKQNEI
jgi:hypothetical protein